MKIISFEVTHKNKKIYDATFCRNHETAGNHVSVLIGKNGLGKSHLLSLVVDFLRVAHDSISNPSKNSSQAFKYHQARLIYVKNNRRYEITKTGSRYSTKKDENEIDLTLDDLPAKIIALSFMVNDKFSFSNSQDDYYQYLGVRSAANATYTSTAERKSITNFNLIKVKDRLDSLKPALEMLGMTTDIKITHKLERKTLFTRGLTFKVLSSKISSIKKRKRSISARLSNELSNSTPELINKLNGLRRFYNKEKNTIEYEISRESNLLSKENIELIKTLEELEFVAQPSAQFKKNDHIDFEYVSSGERNILFSISSILANIEDDSLVLIDEPEISLHPEWQMRYIPILRAAIDQCNNIFCVVATHSHLIISDLESDKSDVIKATETIEEGIVTRVFDCIDYSTYAWSAESILLQVFGLRTTRNFYFERELNEVLQFVAGLGGEKSRSIELLKKFQNLVFDRNDPLNELINSLCIKLGNNHD